MSMQLTSEQHPLWKDDQDDIAHYKCYRCNTLEFETATEVQTHVALVHFTSRAINTPAFYTDCDAVKAHPLSMRILRELVYRQQAPDGTVVYGAATEAESRIGEYEDLVDFPLIADVDDGQGGKEDHVAKTKRQQEANRAIFKTTPLAKVLSYESTSLSTASVLVDCFLYVTRPAGTTEYERRFAPLFTDCFRRVTYKDQHQQKKRSARLSEWKKRRAVTDAFKLHCMRKGDSGGACGPRTRPSVSESEASELPPKKQKTDRQSDTESKQLMFNGVPFEWTNKISPDELLFLYEALLEDKSGFLHNRSSVLGGWKRGSLWMPKDCSCNTTAMRAIYQGIWGDDFKCFFETSRAALPACFLFDLTDTKAAPRIVWVHSKIRRRGVAMSGIRQLKCATAKIQDQLEGAAEFWRAVEEETERWR